MSRTSEATYVLTGRNLGRTAKAVRFLIEKVNDQEVDLDPAAHWFPLSQVVDEQSEVGPERLDTITVKQWIMQQKELL